MSACQCKVCGLLRRIKPLLDRATADEKAAFEEIFEDWECSSMDASYWEMKYKGTWPSPTPPKD